MSHGLIFSESVLLQLVDRGLTREDAYALVQRNAMKAWKDQADFKGILLSDPAILEHLTASEIEAVFDLSRALRWVDAVVDRVFSQTVS